MKVLLSVYACSPGRGSEPGNGWSWATGLASAGHEVTALTSAENRDEVMQAVRDGAGQGRLRVETVELPALAPPRFRDRYWSRVNYVLWQQRALPIARRLAAAERFDVVHHATLGSLTAGTPLWRLGPPLVFGPVGGGQTADPRTAPLFGPAWRGERLRTVLTHRAPWIPGTRRAARHAAFVLATNRDTLRLAQRLGASRAELFLDAAIPSEFLVHPQVSRRATGDVTVLWVGGLVPRKGLELALRAFAAADLPGARLMVVGDGPLAADARKDTVALGVADRVRFLGAVPWRDMRALYDAADLFLWTSLRDSSGSQLLEAMARALPVVMLDQHGAADFVPDGAARKVPVGVPEAMAAGLARALEATATDPHVRRSMGAAAWEQARSHTWPEHVAAMSARYAEVIDAARKT